MWPFTEDWMKSIQEGSSPALMEKMGPGPDQVAPTEELFLEHTGLP